MLLWKEEMVGVEELVIGARGLCCDG